MRALKETYIGQLHIFFLLQIMFDNCYWFNTSAAYSYEE